MRFAVLALSLALVLGLAVAVTGRPSITADMSDDILAPAYFHWDNWGDGKVRADVGDWTLDLMFLHQENLMDGHKTN